MSLVFFQNLKREREARYTKLQYVVIEKRKMKKGKEKLITGSLYIIADSPGLTAFTDNLQVYICIHVIFVAR